MNNPFSLQNKTILVTGASSGIGKQTCITLAQMGANVVATARHEQRLAQTLSALPQPERHLKIVADLTQPNSLSALVSQCPNLSGIVHSAGLLKLIPFKFATPDALDQIMQLNFYAPMWLTQQLLKQKKIESGASILFLSSISGNTTATLGHSLYASSKTALNGLTKVLAIELAGKKIRVNSLLPGMVRTELMDELLKTLSAEQLAADEKRYPLGYGNPENISQTIAFFMSDASQWITGTNLVIDGGFSLI